MVEEMIEDLKRIWDRFGCEFSHDTMGKKVEGVIKKHILLAKKKVFDDIDREIINYQGSYTIYIEKYKKIKQRHLSTFENKRDIIHANINSKSKILNSRGKPSASSTSFSKRKKKLA